MTLFDFLRWFFTFGFFRNPDKRTPYTSIYDIVADCDDYEDYRDDVKFSKN